MPSVVERPLGGMGRSSSGIKEKLPILAGRRHKKCSPAKTYYLLTFNQKIGLARVL